MIKNTVRKFLAILFFCNFVFTSVGFSSGGGNWRERCISSCAQIALPAIILVLAGGVVFIFYNSIGCNIDCYESLKAIREVAKNITQIRADSDQNLK